MSSNKDQLLGLIGIAAIGFSAYHYFKKDEWRGWYYPDACLSCESQWVKSPSKMGSLEDCRAWAMQIRAMRSEERYDYECGKNCKESSSGLNICEETLK